MDRKQSKDQNMADLLKYVIENGDEIIDDELTRGRIRSIYTQITYGIKGPREVAHYYGLPVDLVRDIANRKVFASITADL